MGVFETGQLWAAQLTEATAGAGTVAGFLPAANERVNTLKGKKKKSRHRLVEMVPEFIITESKARSFYCFNWKLSLDSGLRGFGDWKPGRCECVCVCVYVCV